MKEKWRPVLEVLAVIGIMLVWVALFAGALILVVKGIECSTHSGGGEGGSGGGRGVIKFRP
jgi:hypothetical protein